MAVFSDLSEDLVLKIFSGLGIKPLHRMKCVSKPFLALVLISLRTGRRTCPRSTGLLFETVYQDADGLRKKKLFCAAKGVDDLNRFSVLEVSLDFLPCEREPNDWPEVDHYCNGLLLCHGRASVENPYSMVPLETYFVCNPITKQWTALPRPQPRLSAFAIIVAEPSNSPHYKVIRYFKQRNEQMPVTVIELEIFSSKTKKWKRSEVTNGMMVYYVMERSVVVLNGVVYHHLAYPPCIVALDVNGEEPVANTIALPNQIGTAIHRCLGLLQGKIHFSGMDLGEIKVWRLNNVEQGVWELRYKLDVGQLMNTCPRTVTRNARTMYYPFVPIGFSPDREVVYLEMPDGIMAFNLSTYKFEEYYGMNSECLYMFANLQAFPFFPSLYDPSSV